MPPEKPLHFHLIGVAGSAMGNLAAMLKKSGFRVSGSDQAVYPPMSEMLVEWGIEVLNYDDASGFDYDSFDAVVVGNAVSRGNAVLEECLNRNLPYYSMSDVLARHFLHNREVIVVAGTHGKSTTTALIAHMLQQCGLDPSWFFGGVGLDGQPSHHIGQGRHFVIEGDEYDTAFFDKAAKFFHYRPRYLVLTSLEYDHADIYDSLKQIETAFTRLVRMVPSNGLVIANRDYKALRRAIAASGAAGLSIEVQQYGLLTKKSVKKSGQTAGDDHYRLTIDGSEGLFDAGEKSFYFPRWQKSGTGFAFQPPGVTEAFDVALIGRHNMLNLMAAWLLGRKLGLDNSQMQAAVAGWRGIRRRQNILVRDPFTVVDDFAHHPTAVKETIRAVKETFDGEVWAAFEPRSATAHLNTFQDSWPAAFKKADRVFLCDVFNRGKFAPERMLDIKATAEKIRPPAVTAANPDALYELLAAKLAAHLKKKKSRVVVLVMSNGSFGNLAARLVSLAGSL